MNRNCIVDYYQPDISNSCLYDQSVNVNCILQTEENAKYTKWNTYLNDSYVEPSSTSMRCFIEPRDEFKLKTDQYLNDYRCHVYEDEFQYKVIALFHSKSFQIHLYHQHL